MAHIKVGLRNDLMPIDVKSLLEPTLTIKKHLCFPHRPNVWKKMHHTSVGRILYLNEVCAHTQCWCIKLTNPQRREARKLWQQDHAQLSRDVTVSPVNFEGVIITGKYCTNYDSNTGIFSGAHLL